MTSSPDIPDSISSEQLLRALRQAHGGDLPPVSPALQLGLSFGTGAGVLDLSVAIEQLILANGLGSHGCTVAQYLLAMHSMARNTLAIFRSQRAEILKSEDYDTLRDMQRMELCCEILDQLAAKAVFAAISFKRGLIGEDGQRASASDARFAEELIHFLSNKRSPRDLVSVDLLERLGIDVEQFDAYMAKP